MEKEEQIEEIDNLGFYLRLGRQHRVLNNMNDKKFNLMPR